MNFDVGSLVEYTPGQLECIANEIHRRRPDVDFSVPINLELLIEDLPNTSLEIKDGLCLDHSIEEYVCKQAVLGKRMEIRVDKHIANGNWATYNAVLGEEFSHLTIHMALVYAVMNAEDFIELQRDPAWPQYERDAKTLSRALRMPMELLVPEAERLYSQVVAEYGFGTPATTEKFLRNSLSERFRVPPSDMQARMMSSPCHISRRVEISVLTQKDILVPLDWTIRTKPPVFQKSLLDNG